MNSKTFNLFLLIRKTYLAYPKDIPIRHLILSSLYPIIPQSSYLEGLKEIVRLKKTDIKKNKDLYPFDVLIASQTSDEKSHLSYMNDNGVLNEIFDPDPDRFRFCPHVRFCISKTSSNRTISVLHN